MPHNESTGEDYGDIGDVYGLGVTFYFQFLVLSTGLLRVKAGPHPPAVKTHDQEIELFKKIGIEPDLVEKKDIKDDSDDPDRPVQNPVLGGKPDAPNVENGAEKLDVAHGVSQKSEKNRVDVEIVLDHFFELKD
jgi:hypothetical protein